MTKTKADVIDLRSLNGSTIAGRNASFFQLDLIRVGTTLTFHSFAKQRVTQYRITLITDKHGRRRPSRCAESPTDWAYFRANEKRVRAGWIRISAQYQIGGGDYA